MSVFVISIAACSSNPVQFFEQLYGAFRVLGCVAERHQCYYGRKMADKFLHQRLEVISSARSQPDNSPHALLLTPHAMVL